MGSEQRQYSLEDITALLRDPIFQGIRVQICQSVITHEAQRRSVDHPAILNGDLSLNTAFIKWAFSQILEKKSTKYERERGREPVQMQRVYECFAEANFGVISLESLTEKFRVPEVIDPREQALKSVSLMNTQFERHDINLEIETIIVGKTSIFYQLVPCVD
jgi:hypothetical protein